MHRRAVLGRGRKQLSSRWWYLSLPGGLRECRLWKDRVGGKARGSVPEAQQLAQLAGYKKRAVPAKLFGQSWRELGRKVSESLMFAGC